MADEARFPDHSEHVQFEIDWAARVRELRLKFIAGEITFDQLAQGLIKIRREIEPDAIRRLGYFPDDIRMEFSITFAIFGIDPDSLN